MEQWKPYPKYKDHYEISDRGRVRRTKSIARGKKGYVLANVDKGDGYLVVALSKNSQTKTHLVHRLVAETFLPNPENKPHVNHIDRNRGNNCVENLEWATASENVQHSHTCIPNLKAGSRNNNSKLTEDAVTDIRKMYSEGFRQKDIAEKYGVKRNTVWDIVNRKSWTHI